jgi:hypothetical protein
VRGKMEMGWRVDEEVREMVRGRRRRRRFRCIGSLVI